MALWTWVKGFFINLDEKNNSELEEDERIINKLQETVEDEEDIIEKEIGIVTLVQNGSIEINKTWIAYEELISVNVGAVVHYCKPKNPETNVVTNIELVKNIEPYTNIENTLHGYKGIISYIDNQKILLNPGSLVIWNNDVEVTFSPESGDYVKLEHSDGNLKMLPQECKVITVEVIEWDGKQGFLSGHIKITREVCENIYVPNIGDQVISCIISCSGDGFQWRSINVSLMNPKAFKSNKKIDVKNIPVFIVPLGSEKVIDVPVKNVSLKTLEIKSLVIVPHLSNVIVLNNPIKQIEPGISVTYKILCKGEVSGWTIFKIEFNFKNFVYNKNIKFLTATDVSEQENGGSREMNFVSLTNKTTFLRIKPKNYEIPSYLLEAFGYGGENVLDFMTRIQRQVPELYCGLTKNTYPIYFHTLLFLEELEQIRQCDKMETVAPLVQKGQYYVLIIDEDTCYSSLCIGDSIILSNPWVDDDVDKPIEMKICMKKESEIYLHFKDVNNFISSRSALFRMKFRNSRTCMIRTHHAIDYFLRYIDVNWLFPTMNSQMNRIPKNNSNGYWHPSHQDDYFFKELNKEQKEAVDNIVFSNSDYIYPYILFGPPGTGKTLTLVEVTIQTILHVLDSRILIAAPSNSAVDTFCELLVSSGVINNKEMLRLMSFNYSQHGQLPVSLVEYSATLSISGQTIDDANVCESDDIVKYKVVAGTLGTLGLLNCIGLKRGHFTHVFIDEAGQTTEPETLIAIAGIKPGNTRVVLSGDPNQLGPVILSQVAKEYGLDESLMMRLMTHPIYSKNLEQEACSAKPKIATMLRKNYRSLPMLVDLTSSLFYKNNLEATISESSSREAGILNEIRKAYFASSGSSLIFVKVDGKENRLNNDGNSFYNLMESATVCRIVMELYKVGLDIHQIGIITPYTLQVKRIRECFTTLKIEPPKVGTVEEFQGSERDVIIVSLVRTSLDKCRISFISEPRRANVALSRAKVMNIIVANEATLRKSQLWEKVLNKVELVDSALGF